MAIVIDGSSVCAVCNQRIDSVNNAFAFPAFIPQSHRLAKFSDCVIHRECFAKCEECIEVQLLYERYRTIWDSRPNDLKSLEEFEAWGTVAFRGLFGDEAN